MTEVITVFHYEGETYIGGFCTFANDSEKPSFPSIGKTLTNKAVFRSPVKLSYLLDAPSGGTAKLKSDLTPMLSPKHFTGTAANLYFAFPADRVVWCACSNQIESTLLTAYKQIRGL